MGNASTKEQRHPPARLRSSDPQRSFSPALASPNSPNMHGSSERQSSRIYQSIDERGSRTNLANFLGLPTIEDRDAAGPETRRETKQEREARKLEKERVAREKERERSMREEHVDGGYLVTQGVYTGPEDYGKIVVRRLMIERRLAPFWRGLQDHEDSWTEHQLIAAARGLPVPAADEVPTESRDLPSGASIAQIEAQTPNTAQPMNRLTVPLAPRSRSLSSEASFEISSENPNAKSSLQGGSSGLALPSRLPTDPLSRVRAKTLASLQSSSKAPLSEPLPQELRLPANPLINGQPIEAYLYKDASECPICFLYYPPYFNRTRCCDQAICSECFVQIKRPDPHPPEHIDPTSSGSEQPLVGPSGDNELVSEPATCPFCKQPEFGISYEKPSFQRGLAYANELVPSSDTPGMSSSISLTSGKSHSSQRRTMSLLATAPMVITTDQVRPDWDQKLVNARMHQARRSAAATALHTAAYMMGGRGFDEGRLHFGRRGLLRRISTADSSASSSNPHFRLMSMFSDNQRNSPGNGIDDDRASTSVGQGADSPRNRVDDLEEMMMLEAIRLSLASEEERRKKEEKDAKKNAKKKEKEAKKAEKAAKKAGIGHDPSSSGVVSTGKGKQPQRLEIDASEDDARSGETSSRERSLEPASDAQNYLEKARNQIQCQPLELSFDRPGLTSHGRKKSYASSTENESRPGSLAFQGSSSSLELSTNASLENLAASRGPQVVSDLTTAASGNSSETKINFSSLAAMVDRDKHTKALKQTEDVGDDEAPGIRNVEKGRDLESDDEHYFDTQTSSDVKVPTPAQVDEHLLYQHPQAS